MKRRKWFVLRVAVGMGMLLFLLVLSALLAPRFLRLEPLKQRIQADLSRRLGMELDYERLHLEFLPHPRVTFDNVSLSLSERLAGTIASVRIRPEILSLLHGEVRVASVRLRSPRFRLTLPVRKEAHLSFAFLKTRLASAAGLMERKTPGLQVRVENGTVELLGKGHPVYRFEDLQASVRLPPKKLKIEAACSSNLWKTLSFHAEAEPDQSKGTGSLRVSGFDPEKAYRLLFPSAAWQVSSSEMDLDTDFEAQGPGRLQGTLKGSVPRLVLVRGSRREMLSARNLEADFSLDGENRRIHVQELDLTSPRIRLSGRFVVQGGPPQARLSITGENGDIASLRSTGLVLADRFRVTHKIFRIVRAGTVPHIEVDFRAGSLAKLSDVRNLTLTGEIQGGEIFLPPLDENAHGVSAKAVISKAVLTGRDISATVAGSQVSAGTFQLGLLKANPPLQLDVQTVADLGRVAPMLGRLMKRSPVGEQLSLLRDVQGRAVGSVTLQGTVRDLRAKVDLSTFRLQARDPRVPWPVDILSGGAGYDGREINLNDLKGSLGKSEFSGLFLRLPLSASRVEVSAAASSIDLGQVYPWVRSFRSLRAAFPDIESLEGTLVLDSLEAHGPIRSAGAWQFKASGAVQDVVLGSSLLPGSVTLAKGGFEADPETASLEKAAVAFLDASLEMSATLHGFPRGLKEAEASFQGDVGPRATAYIYNLVRVPSDFLVRSPMTVSQAQVSWTDRPETGISAAFSIEDGPQVTLDALFQPEATTIRKLTVRQGDSESSLAVDRKKGECGGSFKGILTKSVLDGLLVKNPFLEGRVQGSFQVHFFLDQPVRSTAEGSLRVAGLLFPGRGSVLKIEDLALDARTGGIDVGKADLLWDGSHLNLQGAVDFVEKWFRFDAKLSADRLDWGWARPFVESRGPSPVARKKGVFWTVPVYGTCELDAKTFTYGDLSWQPLQADLLLEPEEVSVEVEEALLCGISMPGRLSVSPRSMKLDFTLSSKGRELEPTLGCLVHHESLASGSFSLEAEVKTSTKEDTDPQFLRSLHGHWQFTARDGRVNRFGLLASIFSLLDFTPYLRGRLPDLSTSSFPYHSVDARGTLEGEKIELSQALLRSSSLQIASEGNVDLADRRLSLTVLVAPFPFGGADFLVHKIPVLGQILGTSILSFPVSVSGPISDPTIIPLSPSAVGSGLLGIMRRTVRLPLTLVEPLLPGEEKSPEKH